MCYCTPEIRKIQCDRIECFPATKAKPEEMVRVLRKAKPLTPATLSRILDHCVPSRIEDEFDLQNMIDKLWPALLVEFEAGDGDERP